MNHNCRLYCERTLDSYTNRFKNPTITIKSIDYGMEGSSSPEARVPNKNTTSLTSLTLSKFDVLTKTFYMMRLAFATLKKS